MCLFRGKDGSDGEAGNHREGRGVAGIYFNLEFQAYIGILLD